MCVCVCVAVWQSVAVALAVCGSLRRCGSVYLFVPVFGGPWRCVAVCGSRWLCAAPVASVSSCVALWDAHVPRAARTAPKLLMLVSWVP